MITTIGIAVPTIAVGLALYFRHKEIKKFNNGTCKCGGTFSTFDTDSQGGTGWKCHSCNNHMWTSWIKVSKYLK